MTIFSVPVVETAQNDGADIRNIFEHYKRVILMKNKNSLGSRKPKFYPFHRRPKW